MEVIEDILSNNDVDKKCLLFIREIICNDEAKIKLENLGYFNKNRLYDTELENLKKSVKQKLLDKNVFHMKRHVKYDGETILNDEKYLKEFGDSFKNAVEKLITER